MEGDGELLSQGSIWGVTGGSSVQLVCAELGGANWAAAGGDRCYMPELGQELWGWRTGRNSQSVSLWGKLIFGLNHTI